MFKNTFFQSSFDFVSLSQQHIRTRCTWIRKHLLAPGRISEWLYHRATSYLSASSWLNTGCWLGEGGVLGTTVKQLGLPIEPWFVITHTIWTTQEDTVFISAVLSLIKTVSSCVVQIVCVITNQGSSNPNCLNFLKDAYKVYQGVPPTYYRKDANFATLSSGVVKDLVFVAWTAIPDAPTSALNLKVFSLVNSRPERECPGNARLASLFMHDGLWLQ